MNKGDAQVGRAVGEAAEPGEGSGDVASVNNLERHVKVKWGGHERLPSAIVIVSEDAHILCLAAQNSWPHLLGRAPLKGQSCGPSAAQQSGTLAKETVCLPAKPALPLC